MIRTQVVTTTYYFMDTERLVAKFGLDSDELLVIDSLWIQAGTDGGFITLDYDQPDRDEPDRPLIDENVQATNHNIFPVTFSASTSADAKPNQIIFPKGLKILNNMGIISNQACFVAFDYHKEKGTMDYAEENAEVLHDIKKLDSRESRSPGSEFFQAGDIRIVGE